MSIGQRLKEERKRFGYNQTDFAVMAGVQISAQTNYENDRRLPDASYLAAIAAMGVDVLYILTEQRSVTALAPDEAALLDNYRNTPKEQQKIIKETSAAFAKRPKKRSA